MDIHQAQKLIKKGEVVLVDVRDKVHYDQAHIKGAIQANDENLHKILENCSSNIDIICYCHYGSSSENAVAYFQAKGFRNVHNMEGGFEEWKDHYPIVEG